MKEPDRKVREDMQRHIHMRSWRMSRSLHNKTGESLRCGTLMGTHRGKVCLEGEVGRVLGTSFVKGDGFLPSRSSVGAPFLPVSWLLFTGPFRKCFDNNSFLFNVNWNHYISSLKPFFAYKPHLSVWNKSYFPLFESFWLHRAERVGVPPPPFPRKESFPPTETPSPRQLPTVLQGGVWLCLWTSKVRRSLASTFLSLQDACLRNPLNHGPNQPFIKM